MVNPGDFDAINPPPPVITGYLQDGINVGQPDWTRPYMELHEGGGGRFVHTPPVQGLQQPTYAGEPIPTRTPSGTPPPPRPTQAPVWNPPPPPAEPAFGGYGEPPSILGQPTYPAEPEVPYGGYGEPPEILIGQRPEAPAPAPPPPVEINTGVGSFDEPPEMLGGLNITPAAQELAIHEANLDANLDIAIVNAERRIEAYLGETLAPGANIQQVVRAYIQTAVTPEEKGQAIQQLKTLSGRDLIHAVAAEVWTQLQGTAIESGLPGEPVGANYGNQFIGMVASEASRLSSRAGNTAVEDIFNMWSARPNGGQEIFTRMLDFVRENPYEVGDEIVQFYSDLGLIERRPLGTFNDETLFGETADTLPPDPEGGFLSRGVATITNMYEDAKTSFRVSENMIAAITGQLDDPAVPPTVGAILHQELQEKIIPGILRAWDITEQRNIDEIGKLLEQTKEAVQPPAGTLIHDLKPEYLEAIRSTYPELASLSMEQVIRALMVDKSDIAALDSSRWAGAGRGYTGERFMSRPDVEELARLGLLSPVEAHWRSLGLTMEQIREMTELVMDGINEDLPNYVRRSLRDAANQREAEARIAEWVAANPGKEVPDELVLQQKATPDQGFFLSIGLDNEAAQRLANLAKPTNVLSPGSMFSKTIGSLADIGGAGVNQFNRFSGHIMSEVGDRRLDNPDWKTAIHKAYDMPYAAGSEPGGRTQTRVTEIYKSAEREEQAEMEKVFNALTNFDNDEDGTLRLQSAEEFLRIYDETHDIKKAAQHVSGFRDLVTMMLLDTTNLVTLPGMGTLAKATIGGSVRAALRTPSFFSSELQTVVEAGASVRAGQLSQSVLEARADQLMGRIAGSIVVDPRTGNLVPMGEARAGVIGGIKDALDDTTRGQRLLNEYTDELQEIQRLRAIPEGEVVQTRVAIHAPWQLDEAIPSGSGIREIMTHDNVMARKLEQAFDNTPNYGQELADGATVIDEAAAAIQQGRTFGRFSEMGQRSRVVAQGLEATDELRNIIAATGFAKVGDDLVTNIRATLETLQEAGKSFDGMRNFVTGNNIRQYVTTPMKRTLDLVATELNLDELPRLQPGVVKVASSPEEYRRMVDDAKRAIAVEKKGSAARKKAETVLDNIYESPRHFMADFTNDLQEALHRGLLRKHGLKDNLGFPLRLQGWMNGAMSRIFLATPGYVIRNLANNAVVAGMYGEADIAFITGGRKRHAMYEALGMGPRTSGHGLEGRPIMGPDDARATKGTLLESIIGRNDEKWWKRAAAGGVVPGVTNIPFFNARRLSNYIEAYHRGIIIDKGFDRFYTAMMGTPSRVRAQLMADPVVSEFLGRNPGLLQRLMDASMSSDKRNMDEMMTVLKSRTTSGDRAAVIVPETARASLREMGVADNLPENFLTALDDIIADPVAPPMQVVRALDSAANELRERGREIAEAADIPRDVHDALLDLHRIVYEKALAENFDAVRAADLATTTVTRAAQAMTPFYEEAARLQDFLDNPSLYRQAIYGVVDGLDPNKVDDLMELGKQPRNHILEYLFEQENVSGWTAFRDLIDEARNIDEQLALVQPDIVSKANRAADIMHEIQQEQLRRLGIGVRGKFELPEWSLKWNEIGDGNKLIEARRSLDDFITTLSASTPDLNFVFIWTDPNSRLRRMLPGVPADEVKNAIERALNRGHLRKRAITESKESAYRGAGPLGQNPNRPVPQPKVVEQTVPARNVKVAKTGLEASLKELHTNLTDVAEALARFKVENIQGDIKEYQSFLNATRRKLFRDMTKRAETELTGMGQMSSLLGTSDPEDIAVRFFMSNDDQLKNSIEQVAQRFNEVAAKLDLPPMGAGRDFDVLAGAARQPTMFEAPSRWSAFLADEARELSTIELIRPKVAQRAQEKAGRAAELERQIARQNDGWINSPLFDDMRTDDLLRAARDIPEPIVDERGLREVVVFRPGAGVAKVPEGNPPAFVGQVDGHVFMELAPPGYKAGITTDRTGGGLGRVAMFVRDDATRDDVRKVAQNAMDGLKNVQADLAVPEVRAIREGQLKTLYQEFQRQFTPNRFEQNPLGFYATPPAEAIKEPTDWLKRELAPFIAKAEAGDEAAILTLRRALKQRAEGWPITGATGRPLQEVYDNFAKGIIDSPFYLATRGTTMTPEEADGLIKVMNQMALDKNIAMQNSVHLANAQADWILHNYANTGDLDFLLRWIGPWHIWPTRTLGKLLVKIADDPKWLAAYAQFQNVFTTTNDELPDWMQNAVPANLLLGAAGRMGLTDQGDAEATLSLDAFLFNQGLFRSFDMGNEEEQTRVGRLISGLDKYSPISANPLFTWIAAARGDFGEQGRNQVFEGLARRLTAVADLELYVAERIDAMLGNNLRVQPTNLIQTRREREDMEVMFALMAMEEIEKNGAENNQRLDDIMQAGRDWARAMDKTEFLNGIFKKEGRNPIVDEARSRVSQRNTFPTATGMMMGTRMYVQWDDKKKFLDSWHNANNDFHNKEFTTTADRDKARAKLAKDLPAFALYAQMRNNEGSVNARHQAQAEYFAGTDENRRQAEAELANVAPENVSVIEDIIYRWHERDDEVRNQVKERYGIDMKLDREGTIQYSLSPEAETLLLNKIGKELPMSMRNNPEEVEAYFNQKLGGIFKGVPTPEEIRGMMDNGLDPAFLTPTALIGERIETYISGQIAKYTDATTPLPNHRLYKNGEPTNALDFDEWNKHVKAVEERWGDNQELEIIKQMKKRNTAPTLAVDDAIEDTIKARSAEYWDVVNSDLGRVEKERAIDAVLSNFKPLAPDEVYNKLMGEYGDLWEDKQGTTRDQLLGLIRERLTHTTRFNNLSLYTKGSYEANAHGLIADISTIEKLQETANRETDPEKKREAFEKLDEAKPFVGHFKTPSGYVVTTREEAEEFLQAVKQRETITTLWNKGLKANPKVEDFPLYFKYFAKGGENEIALQQLIDALFEPTGNAGTDRKNRDAAFELINNKSTLIAEASGLDKPERKTGDTAGVKTGEEKVADTYTPSGGSIRVANPARARSSGRMVRAEDGSLVPESFYNETDYNPVDRPGVKSAGTDVTRLNSSYRVDYIEPLTALSVPGEATKAFMVSKFLGSANKADLPPNYVFETLAQNQVTTKESVVDFWTSIYNTIKDSHSESLSRNQNVANLVFALEHSDKEKTGEPKVATSTYIYGIQGLLETIFDHPTLPAIRKAEADRAKLLKDGETKDDKLPKIITTPKTATATRQPGPSPKAAVAQPSTRGVGGMPEWQEVVGHISTVFQDPSLTSALVAYFQNPRSRLSRSHTSMLQLMHTTFPLGIDVPFEQYLTALKLIWQTATLIQQPTSVNPARPGYNREPRIARFRGNAA